MSSHYNDPTAGAALGAVSREWRKMARLAADIRRAELSAQWNGARGPEWARAQRRRFTGIYKRLLSEPDETLEQMSRDGR